MLLVTNENGGALGLTAIPDRENGGLLVQTVEPDSRADKGKLRRGDRILEINGINLIELSEASVQDQLKKCIASSELRLRVIRARSETKDRSKLEKFEAEAKGGMVNGSKSTQVSPTRKPGSITTASLQVANTRKLGRRIEIILKKGVHGLGFSVTTRDNQAGGDCPIYIKNILPKGAAIEDGRLKPGDRLLEVDDVIITGKSQSEVVNILRATQPGAVVRIVVSRQQEIPEIDEREIGTAESEPSSQKNATMPKQPPPPILPKNVLKSPSAPNILDMVEKKRNDEAQDSVRMKIKKFSSPNSSQDQTTVSPLMSANIFPWRNREILTFHIPVHDSEKAGLGVSVKGKTGTAAPNPSNAKHDGDLGIFIKSVLHGGAASRDGRLKMNDQLLSVNGISLLGQSNADAMDTLRRAMLQTGGKYPGVIVLKIARRASSRPSSTIENGFGEQHVVDSSGGTTTSDQSGSTVIYLSPSEKTTSQKGPAPTPPTIPQENGKRWSNPVLDRLTGGTGSGTRPSTLIAMPAGLRNDSYYMATNENWSPHAHNLNNSNGVLIEEDPEPTSPLLSMRPDLHHQISTSTPTTAGDITYDSQLSLENPVDAFSRDAIGRRSMSEKHHAALDAKETGTYQRNKKIREERERSRNASSMRSSQHHSSIESLTNVNRIGSMKTRKQTSDLREEAMDKVGDLGPRLGMKKSSSLESLQTMVQEIQMSDEPRGPSALRAPRGRGREEEVLRAAVERPETREF
jgi:partitioning defective protein 3